MSALKVCVLAAVMVASLAQGAHHMGSTGSCPAQPTSGKWFYANGTVTCHQLTTCETAFCTCNGGTRSGTAQCTYTASGQSAPSCSKAAGCVATYLSCVDTVALGNSTCGASKDLRMSLMGVETGTLYNASDAYKFCKFRGCRMINASAGNNCTFNFDKLCRSPVKFQGTVLLRGDFTAILGDATKRESFAKAIDADLTRSLGITGAYVTRMYSAGTTRPATERPNPNGRRRQENKALVVEYTVPGVTSKNTDLAAKLKTVNEGDGSWLQSTKQSYSTLAGSNATSLTFLGGAEGSGSGAFSAGKFASLIKTAAPTANPNAGTPQPPTPAPGTAGVALQSMLAAVVVAVLSAMLF